MHSKISIITVSKNSEKTIAHTLNSIKSQTYKNIEHIIIDGNSTDRTKDIIKDYIKKKPYIKIKYLSEKDFGIYDAINKGIKLSSGEYISILNSDDIFYSHKSVEAVMKNIEKNKDNELFFFGLTYFRKKNFSNVIRYYPAKNFKEWMLRYGIIPPHPASVIKKSTYIKHGYYDKNFKIAGDFDLLLRFIYVKNIKFKTFNLNTVKMKTGGASGKNLSSYLLSLKENKISFQKYNLFSNIVLILLKVPSKLFQYLFLNQKKLNQGFSYPKEIINNDLYLEKFKVVENTTRIMNKNFVLSGLNLAFLGYYFNEEIDLYKDLYHWQDGIFSRLLNFAKIKKLPGRKLLKNLILPKSIKKIVIIGNLSENSKIYLQNKFKKKIISYGLPYGGINKILKHLPKKIPANSLILITLPTPKQEIIAKELTKKLKKFKIICIGASLSMCSGDEKVVPQFLEKKGLEFLWRLRTDTRRRLFRLFQTLIYFFKGILNEKNVNIVIKKI